MKALRLGDISVADAENIGSQNTDYSNRLHSRYVKGLQTYILQYILSIIHYTLYITHKHVTSQ